MKTTEEILQKIGVKQLNEMQYSVAEAFSKSQTDLMILSPTGSGKTLAYLLPLVQVINVETSELQAIVVVPGRELALQSLQVLQGFGASIRGFASYGGRPTMEEHRQIRKINPHIIFATPGKINDHIDKGNIDTTNVKWIVIDEFDKCLEMGFHDEMYALISRLPKSARQILLSATPAEEMRRQDIVRNHFAILNYIPKEEQISNRIHVYQVRSSTKDKLETLKRLLCQLGNENSIVFLNYRNAVERTATFLKENDFTISLFHGGLEQKDREAALYRFTNASANILLSTDLASRGLDIPNIKNIIHYHLPESEDGYIHRVGRTARWDAMGDSYFILGPEESVPDYVDAEVEEYLLHEENHPIPTPMMATIYIGKGKKDKVSKGDIVGLLCKKAGLKSSEIGRIDVKDYYSYVAVPAKKLSSTLRLLVNEKIKGIRTRFEPLR